MQYCNQSVVQLASDTFVVDLRAEMLFVPERRWQALLSNDIRVGGSKSGEAAMRPY